MNMRGATVLGLVASAFQVTQARADEYALSSGVRLRVVDCGEPRVDVPSLVEMLRVEFSPVGGGAADEVLLTLTMCDPEATHAVLRVERPGGNVTERTADLSSIDRDVRARALALTFAELAYETPGGTLALDTKPKSDAEADSAVAQAAARVTSEQRSTTRGQRIPVQGALMYRYYGQQRTSVFGAAGTLRLGRADVGVFADAGKRADLLGEVTLGSAAVTASIGVLGTAPVSLRVSVDGGLAWASGATNGSNDMARSRDAVAPYFAAHLDAVSYIPVGAQVSITLAGAAGYASGLIAKSDERSVAGIAGPFVSAAIGVRLAL